MLAGKLVELQFPLVPLRPVGVHIGVALGLGAVLRDAGALGGGTDPEAGIADLIVAILPGQAPEAAPADIVLVRLEDGVRREGKSAQIRRGRLPDPLPGQPAVPVAHHPDPADPSVGGVNGVACGDVEVPVRGRPGPLLEIQRRIVEASRSGLVLVIGQAGCSSHQRLVQGERPDADGELPGPVVKAQPVRIRTEVGQSALARCLGIPTGANPDPDEGLVRGADGLKIDDAAAELAGIIGREGLLDHRPRQDRGWKQIQGNNPLKRLRAWQGRPVQEGLGVSLSQSPDIDEPAGDEGDARDPGQGLGGVVVPGALDVFDAEEVGHLSGVADDVRDEPAADNDLFDFRSSGWRRGLGEGGVRRRQGGAGEQDCTEGAGHQDRAFRKGREGGRRRGPPPDASPVSRTPRRRGRTSIRRTSCRSGPRRRRCSWSPGRRLKREWGWWPRGRSRSIR